MALGLDINQHYLHNAQTLAYLSKAAYGKSPNTHPAFRKTVFAAGSFQAFENKKTDTQGFITATDDHLVIVFRGTESIRDWLQNIDLGQTAGLGGKVHTGFKEGVDSVWTRVTDILKRLRHKKQAIWIAGHSLGGALATLAARRLPAAHKPFEVATFGQPRVGNAGFGEGYRLRHNRYVNNHDIVPSVPPRYIPLMTIYAHVGDMKFFDGDGKVVEVGAAAAAGAALGFTPEMREHLVLESTDEEAVEALAFAGVDDHKIDNYIARIEFNLPDA